jgi:hypothetical protein
MKPNSLITAGAILAAGLLLAARADAATSFTLSDGVGDPASVSIWPGQSFTFSLAVTSTDSLIGVNYNLSAAPAASGQLRITGRDITGSPFSDLITSNTIALSPAAALLDPVNDDNLGALVADVFTPVAPGTSFIANYTLKNVSGLPEGDYLISTLNGVATDDGFNDVPVAGATYTLHMLPEPGTAAFGLACFGMIAARRRGAAR